MPVFAQTPLRNPLRIQSSAGGGDGSARHDVRYPSLPSVDAVRPEDYEHLAVTQKVLDHSLTCTFLNEAVCCVGTTQCRQRKSILRIRMALVA